jgi:hypothetical protein
MQFFRRQTFDNPNEKNIGGHNKAIYLMFKKYGIEKELVIPEYNINPPRFVGDEYASFGIDVSKFGLEFGPVNEQGVVALFTKIHNIIGFPKIKYINDFFPDCEATCILGAKEHWVNIEFKYCTRSLYIYPNEMEKWKKVHYLVCWINNNKPLTERLKPTKVLALKDILSDKSVIDKINEHFSNHN